MSWEVSRGRILFSTLLALVLTVLPLPQLADLIRPSFLVLTVLYWSVAAPRAAGVGLGWFAGLLLDVFQGPVLGQHALVLSLVSLITALEHQRIRSKPLFQQSLIVLVVLAFYQGVVLAIDGWTGHPLPSPLQWIQCGTGHPLPSPLQWIQCGTGALIWAPAATLLAQGRRA